MIVLFRDHYKLYIYIYTDSRVERVTTETHRLQVEDGRLHEAGAEVFGDEGGDAEQNAVRM